MDKKFMLYLPPALHAEIKLQAGKAGVSMNEYIATVVKQYIALVKGKNGRVNKDGHSEAVGKTG